MKKVIIVGNGQTAELANFYLANDSAYDVEGFAVSREYYKEDKFCQKPNFIFEELMHSHPPENFMLFAPMMANKVNRNRQKVFSEGKSYGYEFISYISSRATVFTKRIGSNCFILEDNTIQPFTSIADNCVIWSGNHIGHHTNIHHSVFITSHTVISGNCSIGAYSYLGVNCTIKEGVEVAESTMLAMGAVLTSNRTNEGKLYSGNPAREHPKLTSERLLK